LDSDGNVENFAALLSPNVRQIGGKNLKFFRLADRQFFFVSFRYYISRLKKHGVLKFVMDLLYILGKRKSKGQN